MSGKGQPRKAKSPDSNSKEANPTPPGRSQGKAFEEEKRDKAINGPKKQDQQKRKQTEAKPHVAKSIGGRTANHVTEATKEQRDLPVDSAKAKTRARKTSMETTPGHATNTQLKLKPDTPKDITKASLNITKVKAQVERPTKTEGQPPVEKMKTQPRTAATKTAAAAKVKTCANKAAQGRTEAQPDGPEESRKNKAEDNVDSVLRMTLDKLKIRKKDKCDASQVINGFKKDLFKYLKDKSESFKNVEEPLRTGSYYENLKISYPDEFDVMLPIPVDRVQVQPFGPNGAFYSVSLKRGQNPLSKFQLNDILSSYEMLKEFRKEIKTFAKGLSEWTLTRKKPACPAVTLTTKVESTTISLDVVLCLAVKSSWPAFTTDGFKIEQWLGAKVKQEHKRKPYYLVPKYEGWGNVENDGVLARDVWRVSFSHIEKDIIKNHGSDKTCCEKRGASCCRKDCLKLLKHLLHLYKENDPALNKFCSYHAKTTLLHACCSRTKDSEWSASDLTRCFELLLQDFEGHLRRGELYNFFIPSQNLLTDFGKTACQTFANRIKEQREKGFPIFKGDP
uniref:Cyclic GMP-AMP synthase a n=2 Tax=Kryptolebias marmoratus TaxID=37003 RepID=A0A3Q3AYY7_KRYMA